MRKIGCVIAVWMHRRGLYESRLIVSPEVV